MILRVFGSRWERVTVLAGVGDVEGFVIDTMCDTALLKQVSRRPTRQ